MDVQCLIVDDEVELAQMTCEYFEMFGVSCKYVESAQECLAFLAENTAGLILLDINLVNESGFSLCKKIRETLDIPILFISARDSDSDVLIALNIGGDDYIKKPYSLSVLLAKVQVVLKRMEAGRRAAESVKREALQQETGRMDGIKAVNGGAMNGGADAGQQDAPLRLAEEKLCVYLKKNRTGAQSGAAEQEIPLKAKEFALLKCLYEHRGTIVTKEQLFLSVWGDAFYSDGTLNVHIRRLREKLEEDPSEPRLIKTIWGTGYMLEG
ncbi:MAG: response regulator transcription factor [Lachnospiraceae bacterium]|nr:response regulator transcription factor [Lachnospiraceae bacterium]